ncbi:Uu.00g089040.m01.CDS01 [Anthostomella pinea]|uniref:Uu.00g089040.m01.CDS01 n=1 Tax=Anthostomella pinea TaxID=933095 RepID=A0AAI8VH78_9PEZI|nr:Uu.00g089040.m01.CDS01 [Anthostomella pinea]
MASQIRSVALAGATGNVGVPTLKALLETGKFDVTVLIRPGSPHKFPSGVQVKEVDMASSESLIAALRGQDAVVNATSVPDPSAHIRFVDAAIKAGVRRLIPADFGSDPARVGTPGEFPVFGFKTATFAHLQEITKNSKLGSLTWTVVSNGWFLDWNLENGWMGIDIHKKQAEITSGGNVPTFFTTLETIGKAVASVLLHPAETENRVVYIKSVWKTQNELLALAQEALGADDWKITHQDHKEMYDWSMAEMKKRNFDLPVIMHQIRRTMADPVIAEPPAEWANDLLGLKTMTDEEVKEMIKRLVSQ